MISTNDTRAATHVQGPSAPPQTPMLLIRCNNFVSVADAAGGPTPQSVASVLHGYLGYQYKQFLRGLAQIDPITGKRRSIIIDRKSLYKLDQLGRVTTYAGFIPRIASVLSEKCGCAVSLVDLTPPPTRPDWNTPVWENLAGVNFRYRQEELLQHVVTAERGIFNCSMGFGKSFLFGAISRLFSHARIAIVVPGRATAASVYRDLLQFVGLPGRVDGSHRDIQRVTVYSPDSLHHFDDDADIMLVDEVDKCLATTLREKLFAAATRVRKLFAFSGTPYARLDGTAACLEAVFGQELMRVTNNELVNNGSVTAIHVHWLPISLPSNPIAQYKSSHKRVQMGIWRNVGRNAQIANFVRTHYGDPDVQVLISVATVDHALHLWQHLPEFHMAYAGKDYNYFEKSDFVRLLPPSFQPLSRKAGQTLAEGFAAGTIKKVIATDIWSTGCNFPQLQVLVRADARESEGLNLQWAARPNRLYENKHMAVMVDCVDFWDSGYCRKSNTRYRQYKQQGHTQTWPDRNTLLQAGHNADSV